MTHPKIILKSMFNKPFLHKSEVLSLKNFTKPEKPQRPKDKFRNAGAWHKVNHPGCARGEEEDGGGRY